VIQQNRFLHILKELIDWGRFNCWLIKLYKGEGLVANPPFDPALVRKVELIASLYNLSERQVEAYINENLLAKYFARLAVTRDHQTI
jgi:transposase